MTRQLPLFGEGKAGEVAAGDTAVVRIAGKDPTRALSKSQQAFNRLIGRIEGLRDALARWQAFIPDFQRRVVQELTPLQARIDEQRVAMLRLFDAAHDGRDMTRRERAKLGALICEAVRELLTRRDDAALVALHDKYSDIGHDEVQRDEAALLKAMAEDVLGMALDGAEDAQSPDDVLEAVAREMQQRADAAEAEPPEARGRGGSAKARASLARKQQQADEGSGAVRDVYRKLASALHPDRETEPGERVRKTALMQRVNQAYEKRDLLRLLELQIETEQIDAAHLGDVGESRLQHYVAVLKEQVRELERELAELTGPFEMSMPFRGGSALKPADVLASLQAEMAMLRQEKSRVARELESLRDPRQLKAWLKHVRIERKPPDDPFDPIEILLEGALAPRPGRRGRHR